MQLLSAVGHTLSALGFVSTAALYEPPLAPSLPEGPGAQITRQRCLTCHEADLIVQQRLGRGGWERELDKMMRWGAVVEADERAPLLEYLTRHFGPAPLASHEAEPSAAVEATYKGACLTCHEADLIEQQRLSLIGWTREIEKMIRWGAVLSEPEKEALIRFLGARYGVR